MPPWPRIKQQHLIWRLVAILSSSFGIVLSPTITVLAATGVALFTTSSGSISPVLEPFSEIPANTSLALADDATVQFLHYAACEEVTVRGGRVVLTPTGYKVEGGKTHRRELPCRRETVQQSGNKFDLTIWEPGSVLLRGGGTDLTEHHLKLPAKTVFILARGLVEKFSTVRLRRHGIVLAEVQAQTRRLEWPEELLKDDIQYDMLFLQTEKSGTDAKITFQISPPMTARPEEALVLIDFVAIPTPQKN
jgi:hypothetical protein